MITYSQFRPTEYDRAGIGLRDRQDWLVAPVLSNRDAGPVTESNWDAQLKALGGESDSVEIHRFNHWAGGWFEIAIIDPLRADLVTIGNGLEDRLAVYPILDEMDCGQREHDDYANAWSACLVYRDFTKLIASEFDLCSAASAKLDEADLIALRELYEEMIPSGDYYETCDNGANFGRRIEYAVDNLSRERLAAFLRVCRNQERYQIQ